MAKALRFSPARPATRGRGVEYWAFWLNRLSGVVLSLYLVVHLAFLFSLYRGPAAYHAFLAVVTRPFMLALDVLLAAAAIYHGFNGVRLALVGLGWRAARGALWFWAAFGLGLAALAWMALRMLGGEAA